MSIYDKPAQATPEAGKEKETPAPAAAPAAAAPAAKPAEPAAAATPAAAAPAAEVKTSEQLLDEANAATEAWQTETDATKKEELKKVAKDLVEKTKAQMKAEKEALSKPAEKKAPEKYELTLPKDSLLTKERIDKISAYAKEKGLSNEEAQALVERESDAVGEHAKLQKAEFVTINNGWLNELKNDKVLGGEKLVENDEKAARVLDTFGDADFKKQLTETGFGRHPGFFRMMVKIANAMSEDQFIAPGAQAEEKKQSKADKFYPTTAAQPKT